LAEKNAQVARSELDALGPLRRRGDHGREVRGQLERLERQLEHVERLTTNIEQKITDLRADHDPVAWMDDHAEQIRDLRAIDDELSVRARRIERQLVRAAQSDPPEHITAVLGPRPENHAARLQWERGVWAIETYRHREGIPASHEASALGREPARGQDRQRYSETVATVRQARVELGLEPQRGELLETPTFPDRLDEPALDRGPDRDLTIELDYER
jgi:hypothetical protein